MFWYDGQSGGVTPGPIPNPAVKSARVSVCTVVRKPISHTYNLADAKTSLYLGLIRVLSDTAWDPMERCSVGLRDGSAEFNMKKESPRRG